MSELERGLAVWSVAASIWWGLAVWLVHGHARRGMGRRAPGVSPEGGPVLPGAGPSVSLFKPLPLASSGEERARLIAALASFVEQLEPMDELLLGLPESEWPFWRGTVEVWCRREPAARIRVIRGDPPRGRANPKVAWLEVLAGEARKEIWIWSDADVVAPPGLLAELRWAVADPGVGAVTCPYFVGHAGRAAAVLDAAFVNAEFLPGALLLGRRGGMAMTFGAATVFRAADFRAVTRWDELGNALADDYLLGQRLGSVGLSGIRVETLALETTLGGALRHYYRWQKTIRWCRPLAYAALLAILPLLGWGVLLAGGRGGWGAAAAFGGQWLIEYGAVVAICRALRCRFSAAAWLLLALWPLLRALAWVAVWLPMSVLWRGARQRWRRPVA